jgi:hypothetical protein
MNSQLRSAQSLPPQADLAAGFVLFEGISKKGMFGTPNHNNGMKPYARFVDRRR